ncbi:aminotransferase class III-fold pyridoxal phosphate-dependent enzyme [Brenneria nigrifluens DSM 30175 = ATCC 13028]|uniref:Aminotransferase class III-fold pyridoxal phosphate-dependent enzyme n=2 Tax=Pectobacteriaceae TaxID=1903410 RepID=A0A2U1ULS8_9GAMM|nr:aspartate aminotransferase family protein [Brenneria nigrifluens DSM 30175 = ATCC 13028]QCR06766.1 aminotransferase class III-fold pyridoxal phosphate-dependent enzyme [Brenneria nigrifluens DSM 30175 = ATCC 13028]
MQNNAAGPNAYRFWHPMAHPNDWVNREPLRIVKSDGLYVWDDKGRKMLDGFAGLWCVNVGHNRPEVKAAIGRQMDELSYYQLFDGVSHPAAEKLSSKLIEMTQPEGMSRVLYGLGGSDGVETALKVARQYWILQGEPRRTRFISLKNAYHGVHIGGTSVSGLPVYRLGYGPLLEGCSQIESPCLYRNPWNCDDPAELGKLVAEQLEREILYHGADTIAAFIAEPVQGAGGVIVPPANFWPLVREVCDRHGVLLIADEVVTGFGRSGALFGSRGWGVKPDIMVFAKALTAGYVPLSATVFNQRIEEAYLQNRDARGLLMTGYTYGGHPLACAAGLAVLDIVEKENLPVNAAHMGEYLLGRLQSFEQRFPSVGDVRGKGLMIVLDLVEDKTTKASLAPDNNLAFRIAQATREAGAVVRPVGPKLVLAPPLVIDKAGCDQLVNALQTAFEQQDK